MPELSREIYTGVAAYGRFRAVIATVMGTIFGIALLIGGVVLIKRKTRFTETTGATVISEPACVQYHDQNTPKWKCTNIQLSYQINGKEYTLNANSDGAIRYSKGLPISIYYDPTNPANSSLVSDNVKIFGWILLAVGILVLVSAWIWLVIALKFKVAAAASGASGVIGTIRGAFR